MDSIQEIVSHALCTGCGACVGICASGAITMEENAGGFLSAKVNPALCIHCRRCLEACPSCADNQTIRDVTDSIRGNCLCGFIGYASAKKTRREGQSGGVVSALLTYLLDSGKIDGAITNQYDSERNRPKAVYVDTADGIVESAGSYYCQSAVVKTVMEHKDKRLAAVLLGCQAEAIRLFCEKKHTGFISPLYKIGLVCVGQNSGFMMDALLAETKRGVDEKPCLFRFKYSHPAYGGWPGNVLIKTDEYQYRLDKNKRMELKPICEAYRCLLCYDQMCVDADIVCGDPWGISGDHTEGETVIIVRTEKGKALLKEAQEANYITVRELSVEQIMKGETVDGRHRDKVAAGYVACKTNKWEYPYSVTEKADNEFSAVSRKEYKKQLVRMKYSRARFMAATDEEVKRLTEKRMVECKQDKKIAAIKAKLSLPKRCIRKALTIIK